jgi:hypothetical protein
VTKTERMVRREMTKGHDELQADVFLNPI